MECDDVDSRYKGANVQERKDLQVEGIRGTRMASDAN